MEAAWDLNTIWRISFPTLLSNRSSYKEAQLKQHGIPDSAFRAVHRVIKWEQGASTLLSLGADDRAAIQQRMELNTASVSHFS